jgi:hypothetical protein
MCEEHFGQYWVSDISHHGAAATASAWDISFPSDAEQSENPSKVASPQLFMSATGPIGSWRRWTSALD